jgi:hypothetical protein
LGSEKHWTVLGFEDKHVCYTIHIPSGLQGGDVQGFDNGGGWERKVLDIENHCIKLRKARRTR